MAGVTSALKSVFSEKALTVDAMLSVADSLWKTVNGTGNENVVEFAKMVIKFCFDNKCEPSFFVEMLAHDALKNYVLSDWLKTLKIHHQPYSMFRHMIKMVQNLPGSMWYEILFEENITEIGQKLELLCEYPYTGNIMNEWDSVYLVNKTKERGCINKHNIRLIIDGICVILDEKHELLGDKTLLLMAACCARIFQLVHLLVEHTNGVNPNVRDGNMSTALMWTVTTNGFKTREKIINTRDTYGYSKQVTQQGPTVIPGLLSSKIVQFLIGKGCDISVNRETGKDVFYYLSLHPESAVKNEIYAILASRCDCVKMVNGIKIDYNIYTRAASLTILGLDGTHIIPAVMKTIVNANNVVTKVKIYQVLEKRVVDEEDEFYETEEGVVTKIITKKRHIATFDV